jgi:hypothetical protein
LKQPRFSGLLFYFVFVFLVGSENTLSFFGLGFVCRQKMKVCFVRWRGRAFLQIYFWVGIGSPLSHSVKSLVNTRQVDVCTVGRRVFANAVVGEGVGVGRALRQMVVLIALKEFAELLGIFPLVERSLSTKGNSGDNAVDESFFKTLKP